MGIFQAYVPMQNSCAFPCHIGLVPWNIDISATHHPQMSSDSSMWVFQHVLAKTHMVLNMHEFDGHGAVLDWLPAQPFSIVPLDACL